MKSLCMNIEQDFVVGLKTSYMNAMRTNSTASFALYRSSG